MLVLLCRVCLWVLLRRRNWPQGSEGGEEVGEEGRKPSKNRTETTSGNNIFLQVEEGTIFHLQMGSIILRSSLKDNFTVYQDTE